MTMNKWEQFATSFEEKNNYVVGIEDINKVKEALTSFPDLGNVLELGCGNGTYTESIAAAATAIVATDLSEDMVAVTRERFKTSHHIQVEQADCFNLRYPDNSFDTVFMANLLHIVPNQSALLSECLRVLKDGGRLIVVSFTLHGMTLLNQLALKYRYVKTYGTKSSNNAPLSPDIAKTLCQQSGFNNPQIRTIGNKVKAVLLAAEKSI